MSRIIFNEFQRKVLESNLNVASVSDRAIQYTAEFKILAVKENLAGKGPTQIFAENGFDLSLIGSQKAASSLNRWRNTFNLYGEKGFLLERRGKGSTGHPPIQQRSILREKKEGDSAEYVSKSVAKTSNLEVDYQTSENSIQLNWKSDASFFQFCNQNSGHSYT